MSFAAALLVTAFGVPRFLLLSSVNAAVVGSSDLVRLYYDPLFNMLVRITAGNLFICLMGTCTYCCFITVNRVLYPVTRWLNDLYKWR